MKRLLAMLLLLCPTSVNAAELQPFGAFQVDPDRPDVALLAGPVTHSLPLDFRRMLRSFPDIETVALLSEGGDVTAALLVAHEIHERELGTYIGPDGYCYSACAYIFLSGSSRDAQGALGVHQISGDVPDDVSTQFAVADILDALVEFDTPATILSDMFRTPPDQMHIYQPAEAAALGLNRGNTAAAEVPSATLAPELASPYGTTALLLVANGDEGATQAYGTASWVALPGPAGQKVAVRVDIPKVDFEGEIAFSLNKDAALAAVALMEATFDTGNGAAHGAVDLLAGVLVKDEELVPGIAVEGASGKMGPGSFLFAVSDDAPGRDSLRLLTRSRYVDIAFVFSDGVNAILTLDLANATTLMVKTLLDPTH